MIVFAPVYQMMEQENSNSSETTKDKPSNDLIPTCLPTSNPVEPPMSITAVMETSSVSEGSNDCSINSIGYTADVSELQQAINYESPVKNLSTNQGWFKHGNNVAF